MMSALPRPNRRLSRRREARRSTQIQCFSNAMGLGPNIAQSCQDLSEAGARLTVKIELRQGQEIEVDLCGLGHRRPVKMLGRVVWCVRTESGLFEIGVR